MPRFTLVADGSVDRSFVSAMLRTLFLATLSFVSGVLLGAVSALADARLVIDIDTTATGSRPTAFVGLRDHVVFDAVTAEHGREPRISDGTAAGTRLLVDIDPGATGSYVESESDIRPMVVVGDRLFFVGSVDLGSRTLYASRPWGPGFVEDPGIEAVTDEVAELMGVWGDRVVFTRRIAPDEELWVSDGTAAGTERVGTFGAEDWPENPQRSVVLAHRLVVSADTEAEGREPWAIDLISGEAVLLGDIYPGGEDGLTSWIDWIEFDGRVFFNARDLENGAEPWSTDGTPEGTSLFANLRPGGSDSNARSFVRVGDRLFFQAITEAALRTQIFSTDGTAAGTIGVEVSVDGFQPYLDEAVGMDGRLLFSAFDFEVGQGLWLSDGTAEGTRRFSELMPDASFSRPEALLAWQRPDRPTVALFRLYTEDTGDELWLTDGTAEGTGILSDLRPGVASSRPAPTVVGERIYIRANDGLVGPEPWVLDDPQTGLRLLVDLDTAGSEGALPFDLREAGGRVYFVVREASEYGDFGVPFLWSTDGTEAGTRPIVGAAEIGNLDFENVQQLGDDLYFVASDTDLGRELYRLEAGSEGPATLIDLDPGEASAWPERLTSAGEELFYTRVVDGALQLWRLGPEEEGIYLAELLPAPSEPSTSAFVAASEDRASARPPRHRDRSSTTKNPYSTPDLVQLHAWGDDLAIFVLHDGGDGYPDREEEQWLWFSDGTSEGTRRLARVSHIDDCNGPPTVIGDRLVFSAWDEEHGLELWVSGGTPESTGLLLDIVPGAEGAAIAGLVRAGEHAYFTATNAAGFPGLWRTDGTAEGTEEIFEGRATQPVAFEDGVLFEIYGDRGFQLHRLVGEPPRLEAVEDVDSVRYGTPYWLGVEGGLAYFIATVDGVGRELFATDGTAAGTRLVADVAPGRLSGGAEELVRLGGELLLVADDQVHGWELWAADIECLESPETLCLGEDRFQARSRWQHGNGAEKVADPGRSLPLTQDTAGFWFFDPENVEVAVKVLDGTATNGHFWVYLASLSSVEFELDIFDTATGNRRQYRNPDGTFASFGDVRAFPD